MGAINRILMGVYAVVLGGDAFIRNVTDGRTDTRTDDGPTLVQN